MLKVVWGVYGAGGFGREVMPLLRAQVAEAAPLVDGDGLVFIDDLRGGTVVNGHPVLSFEDFLGAGLERRACVAVADSRMRETLVRRCEAAEVRPIEVRASSSVVLDDTVIGPGAVLCHFSHVTSNVTIGRSFHANYYSYVAHDCAVGNFVTLAPAARVNGAVVLEDHVYVGAGAVIRQGTADAPLVVGTGAVIGMGAVVTRSVPPGAVMIGNPARPLRVRG